MVLGVLGLVAVVVVIVVLASGGGDDGDAAGGTSTTETTDSDTSGTPQDFSTPQNATRSLAAAAKDGDADAVLELTCAGHPDCVRQHHADATDEQIEASKAEIRDRLDEFAQLEQATLAPPIDGAEPGVKEVRYLTPDMTGDEYGAVSFVEWGGDWLYYDTP